MKFNSMTFCMKSLSSSRNRRVSAIRFVYKKVDIKYIVLIFILQKYILKVI
jgi:hypothetical protein